MAQKECWLIWFIGVWFMPVMNGESDMFMLYYTWTLISYVWFRLILDFSSNKRLNKSSPDNKFDYLNKVNRITNIEKLTGICSVTEAYLYVCPDEDLIYIINTRVDHSEQSKNQRPNIFLLFYTL